VYEKNFLIQDVYNANEAFVTGTFAGVIPVVEIDGRRMNKGYLTNELQNLYTNDIKNLS
jgi:branched-chain amino acid aminotransferase